MWCCMRTYTWIFLVTNLDVGMSRQIGPAGPILVAKTSPHWPNLVPPGPFWQAKVGPAGLTLAAKTSPGPILAVQNWSGGTKFGVPKVVRVGKKLVWVTII